MALSREEGHPCTILRTTNSAVAGYIYYGYGSQTKKYGAFAALYVAVSAHIICSMR